MTSTAASVYRMFRREARVASVRSIVIAMVLVTCTLVALAIVHVTRQHDVLRLGYQLDREAQHVRQLREINRRLEVELATLTAPERIRRLATQLGMTTVAPDRIRVLDVPHRKKVAMTPSR